MKIKELLETYIPERRSLIIKVRGYEIIIYFGTDLDHNGKEYYHMTAYDVDYNGKRGERYWHEAYNKHFDTRKPFDAAYNRYAKRALK